MGGVSGSAMIRNLAKYGAIIAIAAGLGYGYLATQDFTRLAPEMERRLEALLGVEVMIGGPVRLVNPFTAPAFSLRDVRFNDHSKARVGADISVAIAEVKVYPGWHFGGAWSNAEGEETSSASRFFRFLPVGGFVFEQTDITFDADGRDRAASAHAAATDVVTELGQWWWQAHRHLGLSRQDYTLRGLAISDRHGAPMIALDAVQFFFRSDPQEMVTTWTPSSSAGRWGEPVEVSFPVLQGNGTGAPLPFSVKGGWGGLWGRGEGILYNVDTMAADVSLKVDLQGQGQRPSLSKPFGGRFGFGALRPSGFLSFNLRGDMRNGYEGRFTGAVNGAPVEGQAALRKDAHWLATFEVAAEVLDASRFFSSAQRRPERNADGLDRMLDEVSASLSGVDVALGITARQLIVDDLTFSPVELVVQKTGDRVELVMAEFTRGAEQIKISGKVDARAEGGEQLEITGRQVDVHAMTTVLGLRGLSFVKHGTVDLHLKLKSDAERLRDFVREGSGDLILALSEGEIDRSDSPAFVRDVMARLPGYDPDRRYVQVDCLLTRFDLIDGLALSRMLYLDAPDLLASGSSSLDFRSGQVGLELRPRPKDPRKLRDAVDINVSGPFKDVVVTADNREVARGFSAFALDLALTDGDSSALMLSPLSACAGAGGG